MRFILELSSGKKIKLDPLELKEVIENILIFNNEIVEDKETEKENKILENPSDCSYSEKKEEVKSYVNIKKDSDPIPMLV